MVGLCSDHQQLCLVGEFYEDGCRRAFDDVHGRQQADATNV
jgi:hypothetical protein